MSKNQKDPDMPRHSEPQPGATALLRTDDNGDLTVSFSDGSESLTMNRRDFMRISGVAAATAAMTSAACRYPTRHIVPYVDRPEEVRIGVTNQYASVCNACPSQCGTLIKTRAGRPYKLEGNPQHPVSQGALCARGQASYMDLYDPDRLRAPARPDGSSLSWDDVDAEVAQRIAEARNGGGLRILTGANAGPATNALIGTIVDGLPNARHYRYEPLGDDAALAASAAAYGQAHLPHYRFDQAQLVVSLGSDFLGTWLSPVEFTKQFAARRDPNGDMNRLIAFESTLSLTGTNADHRYRVRPDHLVYVALGLANEIFENHSPAGVPAGAVRQALAPFDVASVAERIGGEVTAEVLQRVAADLAAHAGESIVVAGGVASATEQGVALESAVNLLNAALGNDGVTIDRALPSHQPSAGLSALQELVAEIDAGAVDVLIIDGVNPVYTSPFALEFAQALDNVTYVINTSTHLDETAAHASVIATGTHYLEAWGDSSPRLGVYAIQQPAILPLFDTRSFEDSLLVWFGGENGSPELAAFLEEAPQPPGNHPGAHKPYDPGPFYRYLQNHWREVVFAGADTLATFDQFWQNSLRDGVYINEGETLTAPRFNPRGATALLPGELPAAVDVAYGDLDNKVLHLFSSVGLYDGRQANNGHLQELPDPISRHTWGSYAMVGYRTAQAANLESGQLIEVALEGGPSLTFPVIIIPGVHEDVISIPLGYGRTGAGVVANDLGQNAFNLAGLSEEGAIYSGHGATIRRTSTVETLSVIKGAGVIDVDRHRILATTTLDEYRQDPRAGVYETITRRNLYHDHAESFGDLKWGMAIDMTKCTGCSACVLACQEENNIPVVGRQGILEGREMHWMRIDRYYELPEEALEQRTVFGDPMYASNPQVSFGEFLDEPRILFQPMLCQHCDEAPCEEVCPVLATMQSNDGLNQMSYQACVGTRYCANNCPYKVRRYNWFNYSEHRGDSFFTRFYPELKDHERLNVSEPLPLGYNPDVTVRTRGVMEKCTFCVQRIRRGKWEIMKEGRRTFREGEVVTACQQSCPADAITFGNRLDETHQVYHHHQDDSPRAMIALDDLNTRSAIRYLSRVWNVDEDLA